MLLWMRTSSSPLLLHKKHVVSSLPQGFTETRETLSAENFLPSSSDKQNNDGSTDDINSGSEDEDDTSIESAEEDESDCLESGDDSSLSEQEN